DGWFHVFETTTWTEKTVIKKGTAQSADHPVDLVFGGDDSLTVVGDKGFVTYDTSSGAEKTKVAFKHPSVGLAGRHARFDDGTIGVRLWNGSLAFFDAAGAWQRDVKLPVNAPMDAVDAFSPDGKVWAVAIGKKLHVVDLG